jgi:hypothetical protein
VYFWYQSNGRVVARNHFKIFWMFYDRMTRARTDGSLVRFTVPIQYDQSETAADASFKELASRVAPLLPDYSRTEIESRTDEDPVRVPLFSAGGECPSESDRTRTLGAGRPMGHGHHGCPQPPRGKSSVSESLDPGRRRSTDSADPDLDVPDSTPASCVGRELLFALTAILASPRRRPDVVVPSPGSSWGRRAIIASSDGLRARVTISGQSVRAQGGWATILSALEGSRLAYRSAAGSWSTRTFRDHITARRRGDAISSSTTGSIGALNRDRRTATAPP